MALQFHLSDKPDVKPEDLSALNRMFNVTISMPKSMMAAATAAAKKADISFTVWVNGAIVQFLGNLDNILLARMEAKALHKSELTASYSQRFPLTEYEALRTADKYLVSRGYAKAPLGHYVEACILLRLDAEEHIS